MRWAKVKKGERAAEVHGMLGKWLKESDAWADAMASALSFSRENISHHPLRFEFRPIPARVFSLDDVRMTDSFRHPEKNKKKLNSLVAIRTEVWYTIRR